MNIGDSVMSKKTGFPASGTVAGLVVAPMYIGGRDISMFTRWNILYPDWTDKPIVYVVFAEAIRTATFEEFLEYLPENMKQYDPHTLYETQVPSTNMIAYPIDDLEVVE